MFRNPRHVFILIVLFAILTAIIDIPEGYRVKFAIGPMRVDYVIEPLVLDFRRIGINATKEIRTHLGLDLSGGTHVTLAADMSSIAVSDRDSALESAREVIERRVNFFGVSEPIVQTSKTDSSYRINVELPGVNNVDEAIRMIGQTASLDFREFTDVAEATGASLTIPIMTNTKTVGITGKDLKRAQLDYSTETGEPQVSLEFSGDGGNKFAEVTRRLTGKHLAIFLDDIPITWPRVNNEISDGRAVITGSFRKEDAKALALQLNAGALPVSVAVIEQRSVGATLGHESVVSSIRAGMVGLVIVALFMIAQYGWLGFLADMALVVYGLVLFAIFRIIPITLSLPGVTGFILSIGMAVDSNILIFERYKEERRSGRSWHIAMELAFGKAWDSIRDANVTTLLTCLILYNPGNWSLLPSSGLVRGFAVTLLLGVLVSLFSGIVVSRTFIRVLYKEKENG